MEMISSLTRFQFSVMIRPLFESFQESTVTRTLQEFIQSVLKWFDDNCQLPILRPGNGNNQFVAPPFF